MAKFLEKRVIEGKLKFSEIPDGKTKECVRAMLTADGYEELLVA